MRRTAGFTLVELLAGLTLSLFVISTGVEFFGLARRVFVRLKDREEADQAALAALDRMRIDLLHAGRGLAEEAAAGLVEPVRADESALETTALERELVLAGPAPAGASRLALVSAADIARGQRIVLFESGAGEVRAVAAVEGASVVLDGPLERAYDPAAAAASLLESVAYRLDTEAGVLRRRVNGGAAQPVLELAASAAWSFDPSSHLVRVRLELDVEGAQAHETTVFVKNASLAGNSAGQGLGESGT
jgi:type II secretory pathway pseudopilin PulG